MVLRLLRLMLTPFVLLTERLTMPKGIYRPAQVQQQVDMQTRALALYHFTACPYCVKVRRALRRLSLNIELRNAGANAQHRAELVQGGGKLQVPCLRITGADGQSEWLYESDDIIAYLRARFGDD